MGEQPLTKARRDYKCDCCLKPIPAGTPYIRRDVTPWTSHPDGDPGYHAFHMHAECNTILMATNVRDGGWFLPESPAEWRELVQEYERQQASKKAVG